MSQRELNSETSQDSCLPPQGGDEVRQRSSSGEPRPQAESRGHGSISDNSSHEEGAALGGDDVPTAAASEEDNGQNLYVEYYRAHDVFMLESDSDTFQANSSCDDNELVQDNVAVRSSRDSREPVPHDCGAHAVVPSSGPAAPDEAHRSEDDGDDDDDDVSSGSEHTDEAAAPVSWAAPAPSLQWLHASRATVHPTPPTTQLPGLGRCPVNAVAAAASEVDLVERSRKDSEDAEGASCHGGGALHCALVEEDEQAGLMGHSRALSASLAASLSRSSSPAGAAAAAFTPSATSLSSSYDSYDATTTTASIAPHSMSSTDTRHSLLHSEATTAIGASSVGSSPHAPTLPYSPSTPVMAPSSSNASVTALPSTPKQLPVSRLLTGKGVRSPTSSPPPASQPRQQLKELLRRRVSTTDERAAPPPPAAAATAATARHESAGDHNAAAAAITRSSSADQLERRRRRCRCSARCTPPPDAGTRGRGPSRHRSRSSLSSSSTTEPAVSRCLSRRWPQATPPSFYQASVYYDSPYAMEPVQREQQTHPSACSKHRHRHRGEGRGRERRRRRRVRTGTADPSSRAERGANDLPDEEACSKVRTGQHGENAAATKPVNYHLLLHRLMKEEAQSQPQPQGTEAARRQAGRTAKARGRSRNSTDPDARAARVSASGGGVSRERHTVSSIAQQQQQQQPSDAAAQRSPLRAPGGATHLRSGAASHVSGVGEERRRRAGASLRYVVGVKQLLLHPNALAYEEEDSRLWARGFNQLRRQPSVWDRWRRRHISGGNGSDGRDAAAAGERHNASTRQGTPPPPRRASTATAGSTSRDTSYTSTVPAAGATADSTTTATAVAPASAPATQDEDEKQRARRHARRVGVLKVTVLLLESFIPVSVIIGVPLFFSAVAVSGAVLLPCAGVMAVPAYWAVVKLHNACFSWNTWQSGERGEEPRASNPPRTPPPPPHHHHHHHQQRAGGSAAGGGGPESVTAEWQHLSGGWLLTAQSLLGLAERFGGRPLCAAVVALHAATLVAGGVLMLSTGMLLTGGSANTLAFLRRHSKLQGSATAFANTEPALGTPTTLASGGCQLHAREHLLPLFPPFVFVLMVAGPTTPLRWARRFAYWETAFFKLGTLAYGLFFAVVLVVVQLHWRLRVYGATGPSGHGALSSLPPAGGNSSSLRYPFILPPATAASPWGSAHGFSWLHSYDDNTHWLWHHFTSSFVPGSHDGGDGRGKFAQRLFAALDYTALHLSVSVALLTWLFAFVIFAVKAGGYHFFVVPLLWRGQVRRADELKSQGCGRSESIGGAHGVALGEGAYSWLARVEGGGGAPEVVAVDVATADGVAEGGTDARDEGRLTRTLHGARGLATSFISDRRALWKRRLGAYGVSGFGSSFTIAISVFLSIVATLAMLLFAATPLGSANPAAPLHLRLLWTAVTLENNATLPLARTKDGSDDESSRGLPPPQALVCDLGIQTGLHPPLLVLNAVLSLLLGVLCSAWVPFFVANAASAIVYAPRRRVTHTRTPPQLQEAAISAFIRSKWAVAVREAPAEVAAYLRGHAQEEDEGSPERLSAPHRHVVIRGGGGEGRGNSEVPQLQEGEAPTDGTAAAAVASGEDRGSASARPRTSRRQSQQQQQHQSQLPQPPLRAVAPERLFRLNSAFLLWPEQHRATTRTGVPIRMDKLPQYLRHSTRDLYCFNDRYYFHRGGGGGGGGAGASHDRSRSGGPRNGTHHGSGDDDDSSSGESRGVSDSARLCRRLFTAMLRPSTLLSSPDGFAMRAWAHVAEFALLRLPFLLLCFILAALVVAGPTARCYRFWSLMSLLRAWGHDDGSPNRLRERSTSAAAALKSDKDGDMCAEPILTDIDAVTSGRVILAAASTGGTLVAPLVFGLPLVLLLQRSLVRRREEACFDRRLVELPLNRPSFLASRGRGSHEEDEAVDSEGAREAVTAGGLAGAQCFAQQQSVARRTCAVPIRRGVREVSDEDESSVSSHGVERTGGAATAWASRCRWVRRTVAGCLGRWYDFLVHRYRFPLAAGVGLGMAPLYGAAHCQCQRGRGEPSGPDSRPTAMCSYCLARHRRWWARQSRASRTAECDPQLPPTSSAFYTKHLYEDVVKRRAEQQQQHRPSAAGSSPTGRDANESETDSSGVHVPLLQPSAAPLDNGEGERNSSGQHGLWKLCRLCGFSCHAVLPACLHPRRRERQRGGSTVTARPLLDRHDYLGSLTNALIVTVFFVAWVLAVFGAVRAMSLLY